MYGFFGALLAAALLFALEPAARTWSVMVFAASVAALLGTSALYHRVTWSRTWYRRIRRLDHAMIFVLITGTETPLFFLALEGQGLGPYFAVAYGMAAAGFLITMVWSDAPKWLRTLIYIAVGWSGLPAAPALLEVIGPSGVGMLVLGGVLYSVGAAAYGLKWPNPVPGHFGPHEVFHAFVLAAVSAHYAAIVFWVVA